MAERVIGAGRDDLSILLVSGGVISRIKTCSPLIGGGGVRGLSVVAHEIGQVKRNLSKLDGITLFFV